MTEKPEGMAPLESWSWDVSAPGSAARANLAAKRQIETRGYYQPPAAVTERARARSPLFVRFGDAPEGGRSTAHNGRRGGLEPGVCVFRARREGGETVVDASESPLILAAFHMFSGAGRPAFYATGEEVGRGTAGEPCLKDPRLEPVEDGTRIGVSEDWELGPVYALFGLLGPLIGHLDRHPELRGSQPTLNQRVDALLESWGHKDVADERREARARRPPARGRRDRAAWAKRRLEELEREADPFGRAGGSTWT